MENANARLSVSADRVGKCDPENSGTRPSTKRWVMAVDFSRRGVWCQCFADGLFGKIVPNLDRRNLYKRRHLRLLRNNHHAVFFL